MDCLQALPPQAKVYRSQRIWSMYVDLVEALGTFQEAREVYDKMIDNKVASPQVILNYAEFLANQRYWEDSFQVYEKGIANFKYPHAEIIWRAYLTSFVDRHKGSKLERARDLFQQACEDAPPKKRKQFYLMHADFEEKYGLARHCYSVYEAAAKAVPKEERVEVYRLYADRAQKMNGIPKVREVYQMACEAEEPYELPDRDVIDLAVEFATIEKRLQEIARARCATTPFTAAALNHVLQTYPFLAVGWYSFCFSGCVIIRCHKLIMLAGKVNSRGSAIE
jgi:pre-mRNA-splicing factor SYF1